MALLASLMSWGSCRVPAALRRAVGDTADSGLWAGMEVAVEATLALLLPRAAGTRAWAAGLRDEDWPGAGDCECSWWGSCDESGGECDGGDGWGGHKSECCEGCCSCCWCIIFSYVRFTRWISDSGGRISSGDDMSFSSLHAHTEHGQTATAADE